MKESDNKACRDTNSKTNNDYDYDYVDDSKIILDMLALTASNPNSL